MLTTPSTEGDLLLEALLRVMRDLRVSYDASARSIGLTMARARALSTLARMEGATQAELADAIGIEPPTLKRQLDALEADGYVERRAHDGDVRKRALFLTPKSKAARTTTFIRSVRAELMQDIPTEEQALVRRVLEQLETNIAKLDQK